jgi:hypothetical protein
MNWHTKEIVGGGKKNTTQKITAGDNEKEMKEYHQ